MPRRRRSPTAANTSPLGRYGRGLRGHRPPHTWRALDPTETPAVGSVYRLYQAYFLRDPDTGGMYYWIEQYGGGVSLSAVSNAFVISDEFVGRYGALDVPNFVRLVYVNVLGREPDPDGYNHWAGLLAFGGLPAANMMIGFSESPEYRSMTGTA